MLFNSLDFLIFLILVFALFWAAAPGSPTAGKIILFVGSYVFYGWWDWRFLLLIAFSSGSDFLIGKYLYKTINSRKRKFLLFLSLLQNIGILFVFKYFNFFVGSFRELTGGVTAGQWSSLDIILPVGISFYTFQTLSYTLDIYFRKLIPTKNVLTFFTFVSFFPQLVAGPIERAANLLPQFERKPQFSYEQAASGLRLMLWGYFKKMVIADQLAVWVNAVYGQPDHFSGPVILMATFAFGFQIYCDFSGYSDIAVGTARLFGIELMLNFRTPYFAASFKDFWQRWHISLSTWFRDYLYIPMGGSKVKTAKWVRNILVTFLISGLWHGANVTFLLWGLIHGIFYVGERFFSRLTDMPAKLKKVSGWMVTFVAVNLAWIFFRAESGQQLLYLLGKIFRWETFQTSELRNLIMSEGGLNEPGRMLAYAFPLFLIVEYLSARRSSGQLPEITMKPVRWSFYYLLLLMILFLGRLKTAPEFIYFQF